jgi:hypothetical protein
MDTESILAIKGTVVRGGQPVEGAYINLMDPSKDFLIAERRTGQDGTYSFHTTPGHWLLVCRAAGSEPAQREVTAEPGETSVDFNLS